MAEHGELGQRKAAVLHTIVEEYVRTGEPVGSETSVRIAINTRGEYHHYDRPGCRQEPWRM